MNERIDNIIQNRDWDFTDISNLKETIGTIYSELQGELSGSEKLDLVWDTDVDFTGNFGECFNDLVKIKLSTEIASRITILLKDAKVIFGKPIKEVKIVPQETKIVSQETKEFEIEFDGDSVETRAGTIKVKKL